MKMLNELHGRAIALMSGLNPAAPSGRANVKSRSIGERVRARLRMGDEGNAIVEFALILPVLMTLLTGILSFGSAMMNYQELTNATAVGAQALVINRSSTTDPCQTVFNAMVADAPTLVPSKINLTVTMGGTAVNAQSCSGDQSNLVQGGSVTVTALYPCNIGVYGVTISPGCNLTATLSEYEF
jgi:Flp pilus assembly protein TadG